MKKKNKNISQIKKPVDKSFAIRYPFFHTIVHIFTMLITSNVETKLSPPRFKLFNKLSNVYKQKNGVTLLKSIIKTFKRQIFVGAIITIMYASLNLAIPQLIRMFMQLMHQKNPQVQQVKSSFQFLRLFIIIQIFRIFFGQHSKRLFTQLAIKVQSSLAKKLIQKSLNLSNQVRQKTFKSSILQLQNVDLKLVFNLIQMSHLFFQAPFTLIVATFMLFHESHVYGMIGIYWFIIAFLIQLQLDGKMTHCNATKLRLIEQRSQVNYQLLQHIYQAKMIGWQDTIIQTNNDYFIQQNQDHKLFYFYASLYDISILMLPVLVVVSICVYDINSSHPITVEQVYLLLSLLNICYQPMKSFRGLVIALHDGLHSLSKLQDYFNLQQEKYSKNRVLDQGIPQGNLIIQKGTIMSYCKINANQQMQQQSPTNQKFTLKIDKHIQIKTGQRLLLLGRKFQGRSTFISMIVGTLKHIQGKIKYNGTFSYTPQNEFFTKQTVRENIMFFDENITQETINYISKKIKLCQDLDNRKGLDTVIDDPNSFPKQVRAKISVARTLAKQADYYVLDRPFEFLDNQTSQIVQELLRQKQKMGRTVVIAPSQISFIRNQDKIVIIDDGWIKQYGTFKQLKNDSCSLISFFYKSQSKKDIIISQDSPQKKLLQQKIDSSQQSKEKQIFPTIFNLFGSLKKLDISDMFASLISKQKIKDQMKEEHKAPETNHIILQSFFRNSQHIVTNQEKAIQHRGKQKMRTHFKHFITCVPFSQTFFILLIIACAELLHVFIHYFIGHLQQQHDAYLNYMHMVGIQVILTIGLALILYFEGDVSSKIAVIQGNILYSQALQSLIKKRIKWFNDQYKTYIADKFNHDYQQIFIACHGFLGIYKNIIILFVTLEFISSDSLTSFLVFLLISIIFITIFMIFRKIQKKMTKQYYNFKYKYVRVLEESIQGVQLFKVFNIKHQLLKRSQEQYKKLASYKLANSYTMHGLSIACDLASVILLSTAVGYGLELKMHYHRQNLALIATSIHLLMNASQVLKSLVKDTINFQTFFSVNLVPFMEIRQEIKQEQIQKNKTITCIRNWNIQFDFVRLRDIGQHSKNNSLLFNIKEGQKILIYQTDSRARQLLLRGLTCNLPMLNQPSLFDKHGMIKIGDTDIRKVQFEYLRNRVAVIMSKNFYMTGTIRQNLYRKVLGMEDLAYKFIKLVNLHYDIPQFKQKGLDATIKFEIGKVNHQITKKFALVRILLRRPRIIIIKDTPAFIGSLSIIQIIDKYIPDCTIIKISGKLEASSNTDRIVYMQDHQIIQDEVKHGGKINENSKIYKLLKDINIQGYLYMNKYSKKRFQQDEVVEK